MKNIFTKLSAILAVIITASTSVYPCTAITLESNDGGVVVSRTVERALNDAQHHKILIGPRNNQFIGQTPEDYCGKKWNGKYGDVSLTAYGQSFDPDAWNEEGLYAGVYDLPDFTEYAIYDSTKAENSMNVGELMQRILSSFKTVGNSPTYDWHLRNYREYLNLSINSNKQMSFDGSNLKPLVGGSGLIALPEDFTPTSRFVRASVWTASCRPLETTLDAVFESFRILDKFNIPLGVQVPKEHLPIDIVSVTPVTSSSDWKNKVYYHHAMRDRQIRKVDLNEINFATIKE